MQELQTDIIAVEYAYEETATEAVEEVALDDWPDIVWDYLVVSETEWSEEHA